MKERIAMLFPGQGIQQVGMCRELYKKSESARKIFHLANDILHENIVEKNVLGNESIAPNIVQPFIVTASMAYYRTFIEEYGLTPVFVAGHSLGEYSALIASECIKFDVALELIKERAAYMLNTYENEPGSMVAIMGIELEKIQRFLIEMENHKLYIANINSPGQTVIAGYEKDINYVMPYLEKIGAKVFKLNVNVASHCPLLGEAAKKMGNHLKKINFMNPKIPVISNVSGLPYSYEDIQKNLERQLVMPVQWVKTIKYLRKQKIDYYLDVGPGNVLKNLNIRNNSELDSCTYSLDVDSEALKIIFSKSKIKKPSIETMKLCYKAILCTKNYGQKPNYYENVIEPTRKIMELYRRLENEDGEPTDLELKSVVNQTVKIMQYKEVPIEEYEEKINN